MYVDKDLIEVKLYQLIDQFNKRKTDHRNFYFVLFGNIYTFYDENGRTYKILFVGNFNEEL